VVEFLELRAEIADAVESGAPRDEGALAAQQDLLLFNWRILRTLVSSHISAGLPLPIARVDIVAAIERRRALLPELHDALVERGFWIEESEWEEGEVCPICRDDEDVDSDVAMLPCRHKFHLDCIAELFDRAEEERCPFCRQQAHEVEVGNGL
jgi:hypothetical protein